MIGSRCTGAGLGSAATVWVGRQHCRAGTRVPLSGPIHQTNSLRDRRAGRDRPRLYSV